MENCGLILFSDFRSFPPIQSKKSSDPPKGTHTTLNLILIYLFRSISNAKSSPKSSPKVGRKGDPKLLKTPTKPLDSLTDGSAALDVVMLAPYNSSAKGTSFILLMDKN